MDPYTAAFLLWPIIVIGLIYGGVKFRDFAAERFVGVM